MKAKIYLDKGESILEAEEELIKSLKAKHECKKEKYSDPAVEEFANLICKDFKNLLDNTLQEIQREIDAGIKRRN